MSFELVEPDNEVFADYVSRFAEYNAGLSGWSMQTFSLVQRDGDRIVAGVRGHVYLGALEVSGLWLDEDVRGSGLGARLLASLEAEARRRGARRATLWTYSWQAQVFYEKQGYREYGRFNYPDGHARIDMQKEL
ncbi:MAG: GNAT family N-acetyltransferase [Pseudomonadota bacterium]